MAVSGDLLAILLAIAGIAATFLASLTFYLRGKKVGAEAIRVQLDEELRRASRRIVGDVRHAAEFRRTADTDELGDLKARSSDKGFPNIREIISDLDTPLGLYNESVSNFKRDVRKRLAAYGDNCVDVALKEEVPGLPERHQIAGDWLFDAGLIDWFAFPKGGWLKSICLVFTRCGFFPTLASPPGSGGVMVEIDGESFVVSDEVMAEATRFFNETKARLVMIDPFREKLLEVCGDVLTKIQSVPTQS